MARKRGGLAGIWDRNKNVIKQLAPIALGAIPGIGVPLAAGARAAMEGFDRPGKGGIGFDVGAGLRGAVQGAGQGALGTAARVGITKAAGGLKNMFTPARVGPDYWRRVAPEAFKPGGSMSSVPAASAPSVTGSALSKTGTGITKSALETAKSITENFTMDAPSKVPSKSSWLSELFSPKGIGGVASGALDAIKNERKLGVDRAAVDVNRQRLGLEQSRFAEEQRLAKLDEERRKRVAQLMALFAPSVLRGAGFGGQAQGGAEGGAQGGAQGGARG